jgi:predicted enzyme related to lactoylglutathione lyase
VKILRTLIRVYTNDLENTIKYYEDLYNEICNLRFDYEKMNLKLAQVGNVLILSGSDQALEKFKDTRATFIVDSIEEYKKILLIKGAKIIRDIMNVPTGKNMTVKHNDGTIIEYVEKF